MFGTGKIVKIKVHENDHAENTSPHCKCSRLRVHTNLSLPHLCYRRQHFNSGQHLWCIKHNISPSSGRSVRPAVAACSATRTTDTQWRHKSKKLKNLDQCGRKNMLWLYLKIWEWDWIFGLAVKTISPPGVRSPCLAICKLNSGEIPEKSNIHFPPLLPSKVVQDLFGST